MSDTARIAIGVSIEHMDAITDLSTSLDTLTVAYSKFLRVNQEFRANSDMSRVFGNLGDATDETRVRIINLARNLSVLDDAFNASSGASGKLMSSFGDNEKIIKEIGLAMANMAAQFTKGMTVNSQEITGFTGEYSQFLKKLQAMTGVSADNIEQTIAGMLGSPQHFQALLANMGAMVKLAQKFRAGAPKDVTKTSGLGQWNTAGAKAFKAAEVGAPVDFSNFLRESKNKPGNMGNPGDAANRALAESMASVHVYKSEIEAFANDGQQAVLRFTDAWELSAGEVVDSAVKAASKVLEESNALKEFAGTATKTGNAVEQAAATVQEASVEQSQAVEKAADAATQATVGQSQAVEKAANTATQAAAEETKAVEKAADAVEEAVDNTVKAQQKSSRRHPFEGVFGEIKAIKTALQFLSYSQIGSAIIPALLRIEDILNEIATSVVPKLIEAFSKVNVTVSASVESTAKAAESGAKAVEASAQRQVAAADKVAKSMISDQQLYAQRYAEIDDRINSLIAHRATISGKGSKAAKQAVDDEIASLRQLRGEYQSLEAAGTPIANVAYDLQTRRVQQLPDQSTDRGRIQAYNQQVDLGASLSQGLSTTQARTHALNASIGQSMESTASTVQETANEVVQSAEKTQEAAADAADSVHTTALTEQEAREKESEKAKEALLERLKIYKTESTALERLKQYASDIIPTDISGMVRNPLSGGVGFRGNGASVSVGGWDPRQKLVPTPGTPGYQSLFFSFKGDNPPGTELATFPGTFKASYPPGTAGVSRTNPNRKLEETLIERVIAELSPGASVSADALSTISVDKVLNDAAKSVQRVAAREAATAASKASEGVTSGLAAIDAAASNARKKSMQDEAEAAAKRARYSESYLQDLFAISESSLDIVNIYRLADAILQKIASGISVSADEMRTLDMLTEALDGTVEGLNGDFEVTRRTLVEMANARRAAERTIGAASPSMVTFPWENVASASPGRDGRPVMRTAPESQRTTPYGPSGNQIQFSPREIHAIRQQEYNQIFDAIETRSDEFMAKMDNVKRFVTANFKMIAMSISMPIKDAAGYVANGASEISSAVISAGSAIGKGIMKPLLGLKSLSKAVFSGLIEGFRQEVESIKRLSIGERIRDQERALDAVFRAGFRLKMVGMDMQYFGRRVTGVIDEFIGLYGNFELTTMRAAAALGGFGIALKDSTLDQEQKIAKIDENFTSLKESILDATESIAFFTSDEVAKGLYFYASTVGQNVTEVDGLRDAMAALEPMMKVASITGTGYESVIKGVYSVVSQFNSELVTSAKITGDYTALTSRMADVTEKLYYVSNATASEFPDLVNAFKMVGPVAKQSGASFEDMVDVLGRLADIGIKGTMAGRGMRQMFIQMSRPTPKAKKAIEDLFKQMSTPDVGSATRPGRPAVAPQFAGKTYEDVFFPGGKFQGVDTYINSLAEALQYADDATKNFTLSSISTANELPIITALVNDQINVLNGLGDVNKEVGKLSEGSTGKIQEQWSAIEKSVSYAMSRMDRTFETLKITIGDNVSKGLLPFINQLSDGIKQIREWVNNNKELVKNVGAAIGVIGGLSVAFGSLLMVMGSLVGLVAAAKLVFTAFFPVFGILGGAIGGVIAFAIILTQRFDEIQRAAQKLQQNFVNVSGSLQQNSSAIFDMLKDAFQPLLYIGNSLVDLLLSIIKALTSATNSVDSTTSSFSALGLVLKLIATYFSVSLIYNVLKFFKIVSIGKTIFKGVFDAAGAAIKAFMAGTVKASFAATLSMQSLKAGVISLGAGLKAAFLSNPVGILLVAITTFAEFAMPFFDSLNKSTQKFRDNLKQTADGFGNLAVAAENSALKVGNAYAKIAFMEGGKGPISIAPGLKNGDQESIGLRLLFGETNVGPSQTAEQKDQFNARAYRELMGQATIKDPATGEIISTDYFNIDAAIAAVEQMSGISDEDKNKYKTAVKNWFTEHEDDINKTNKEAWENLGTKAGHIFLEQVKVESEKFNSDMTSQLGVGEIDYTEMYNRIALTVANRMPFAGDAILTITNEIAKQAAISGGVITPQKLEEIITTIIGNSDWRAAWNAGGYQLSLEDITAQLGLKSVGQAAFDKNKTFLSQKASMLDYMSSIGEQIKSGQLSQDEVKKLLISSNVPGAIVADSMGISLRTTIALNQWVDENRDNPDVAAANEDLYTIIGQMYPDIALDDNADEAVSAWLVPIESAFKSLNASLKSIDFQKKLENIIAISDPYNALAEVFSKLAKSRTTTAMVNSRSMGSMSGISSWMMDSQMVNTLVEQVLIKGEQTDKEYNNALLQGKIQLNAIAEKIKTDGLAFDDDMNKQLLGAAKVISDGMNDPEFYKKMEEIFGNSGKSAAEQVTSALELLKQKFSDIADVFKQKRLKIDDVIKNINNLMSGSLGAGIQLSQKQRDILLGRYLASLPDEVKDLIGLTDDVIKELRLGNKDIDAGFREVERQARIQASKILSFNERMNGIYLEIVNRRLSSKYKDESKKLEGVLSQLTLGGQLGWQIPTKEIIKQLYSITNSAGKTVAQVIKDNGDLGKEFGPDFTSEVVSQLINSPEGEAILATLPGKIADKVADAVEKTPDEILDELARRTYKLTKLQSGLVDFYKIVLSAFPAAYQTAEADIIGTPGFTAAMDLKAAREQLSSILDISTGATGTLGDLMGLAAEGNEPATQILTSYLENQLGYDQLSVDNAIRAGKILLHAGFLDVNNSVRDMYSAEMSGSVLKNGPTGFAADLTASEADSKSPSEVMQALIDGAFGTPSSIKSTANRAKRRIFDIYSRVVSKGIFDKRSALELANSAFDKSTTVFEALKQGKLTGSYGEAVASYLQQAIDNGWIAGIDSLDLSVNEQILRRIESLKKPMASRLDNVVTKIFETLNNVPLGQEGLFLGTRGEPGPLRTIFENNNPYQYLLGNEFVNQMLPGDTTLLEAATLAIEDSNSKANEYLLSNMSEDSYNSLIQLTKDAQDLGIRVSVSPEARKFWAAVDELPAVVFGGFTTGLTTPEGYDAPRTIAERVASVLGVGKNGRLTEKFRAQTESALNNFINISNVGGMNQQTIDRLLNFYLAPGYTIIDALKDDKLPDDISQSIRDILTEGVSRGLVSQDLVDSLDVEQQAEKTHKEIIDAIVTAWSGRKDAIKAIKEATKRNWDRTRMGSLVRSMLGGAVGKASKVGAQSEARVLAKSFLDDNTTAILDYFNDPATTNKRKRKVSNKLISILRNINIKKLTPDQRNALFNFLPEVSKWATKIPAGIQRLIDSIDTGGITFDNLFNPEISLVPKFMPGREGAVPIDYKDLNVVRKAGETWKEAISRTLEEVATDGKHKRVITGWMAAGYSITKQISDGMESGISDMLATGSSLLNAVDEIMPTILSRIGIIDAQLGIGGHDAIYNMVRPELGVNQGDTRPSPYSSEMQRKLAGWRKGLERVGHVFASFVDDGLLDKLLQLKALKDVADKAVSLIRSSPEEFAGWYETGQSIGKLIIDGITDTLGSFDGLMGILTSNKPILVRPSGWDPLGGGSHPKPHNRVPGWDPISGGSHSSFIQPLTSWLLDDTFGTKPKPKPKPSKKPNGYGYVATRPPLRPEVASNAGYAWVATRPEIKMPRSKFISMAEFYKEMKLTARDEARKISNIIINTIRISNAWGTAGHNIGKAWGEGWAKGARDGVNHALLTIKASTVGGSPPKEGPLRTIDKGGHNIGKSWGGAFHAAAVDSIHRGAQEVRRTLDAQNNEFANRGSMDMSINRNDKKHIQISLNVTGDGSANRATMSELRKGLMDALIMADLEHMVEVI